MVSRFVYRTPLTAPYPPAVLPGLLDAAGTNAFEDVAANSVDLVRLIQDGVVAHATPPSRHEKRVEEATRRSAVHHDCYAGGAEIS